MVKGLLNGLTLQDAYRFMIEQGHQYYTVTPFQTEFPHFSRVLAGRLVSLSESDIASGGYVVHTLEASLWCLLTTVSFEEAVLKAVNLGEDTDTTGCVTGGMAGIIYGMEAIPVAWHDAIAWRPEIDQYLERFINNKSATRVGSMWQ